MSTTPKYGYYKAEDLAVISDDINVPGVQAFKDAIRKGVEAFAEEVSTTAKIIITGYETAEVVYDFSLYDKLSFDEQVEMKVEYVEDFLTKIETDILGRISGKLGIAIRVYTTVLNSLVFSAVKGVPDLWYGLGNPDILEFRDKTGTFKSGMYYPNGIDNEANAVRDFIQQDINHSLLIPDVLSGGTVEIDYKNGWSSKSIYTLYNGAFLPQLVSLTNSGDIIAFLKAGGDTNLNAHAYVSGVIDSGSFEYQVGKLNSFVVK